MAAVEQMGPWANYACSRSSEFRLGAGLPELAEVVDSEAVP